MKEITYTQKGDYLIPDIELPETEGTIGKYGMMRKEYLQNHRKRQFTVLVLECTLDQHLIDVDREAREKVEALMEELLKKHPAPDKMADNLAWTQHMNQIKAQAEEIVISEIIYN